jgi:RNA polymerase sigma factor (sigma-70 family)
MARQYPPELQKTIGHAERLAKLLATLEAKPRAGAALIGRSQELRAVVSCAVSDWKAGAAGDEETRRSIASHLEGLHQTVAKQLKCAQSRLACCRPDEAITAVDAEPSAGSLLSALSIITAVGSFASATMPDVWEDSPEMLERFYQELGRVDRHARMLARRLGHGYVTLDDLRAFGREGLLDATRSFKEDHGVPFAAWADLRVRAAMIDGVRKWATVPRRLLGELQVADDSISTDLIPGAYADSGELVGIERMTPESIAFQEEDRRRVHALLASLSSRERGLVAAYFLDGQSLEQAAAAVGMTKSGGSRALKRALDVMARRARESAATEHVAKSSPEA